jgi:tryptophan synthase beta chain
MFTKIEGFLPAPETAHALKAAIEEAEKAKAEKKEKCIVVLYSGHGHFDLSAYDNYLAGKLKDYAYPKEEIEKAIKEIPRV